MSTIKPSDYMALTLLNYPNLTDIEASTLCVLLLEADRCGAFQRVLATIDPSLSASLEMLIWAQAWSQPGTLLTVPNTQAAYIEVLRAHETGGLSIKATAKNVSHFDEIQQRWVREKIPDYG